MSSEKKQKKLSHEQLELFKVSQADGRDYSHLLDFYDGVPKYQYYKLKKATSKTPTQDHFKPTPLERYFEIENLRYQVSITPAMMHDGQLIYPGAREELIEDALRKLACQGSMLSPDDDTQEVGVAFTLSQLREELSRHGHSYTTGELKEGIMVCNSSTIRVTCYLPNGSKCLVSAPLFTSVAMQTREDWENEATLCYVRFNPLVTKAISEKKFRQYNYLALMHYKRPLCRWIYKLLVRRYRQANLSEPYIFRTASFIENSPFKRHEKLATNARDIQKALEDMISSPNNPFGIVSRYERSERDADPKFVIYPSERFVQEVRRANAIHAQVTQEDRDRLRRENNAHNAASIQQMLRAMKTVEEFDEQQRKAALAAGLIPSP